MTPRSLRVPGGSRSGSRSCLTGTRPTFTATLPGVLALRLPMTWSPRRAWPLSPSGTGMTSVTPMPGPGCMGSPPTWSASIAGTRPASTGTVRPVAPDLEVPGHADRVAVDVTAQAMRTLLDAALAALPAGDRDVLLLIAWEQLTYKEVSRALAIPVGTVQSRLHRARTKVRQVLAGTEAGATYEELTTNE